MITNPNIDIEAQKVLDVVARVQDVFGGHQSPARPPRFATDRDIEDDLGRGHY